MSIIFHVPLNFLIASPVYPLIKRFCPVISLHSIACHFRKLRASHVENKQLAVIASSPLFLLLVFHVVRAEAIGIPLRHRLDDGAVIIQLQPSLFTDLYSNTR